MTKRRSQNAVSLFPFLAVLVCTMGALILLLLVTTRRIRQKQEETAAIVLEDAAARASAVEAGTSDQLAEAESRLKSAQQLHGEAANRLETLKHQYAVLLEQRDNLEDELTRWRADVRRRTESIEAQAADMQNQEKVLYACRAECEVAQDEVDKMRNAVRIAESELADAEGAALHAEMLVAQQLSAIEMLREQRHAHREGPPDIGTTKTVIEFNGPRGTARTPIVVNVDADGFLFPSSGVRVRRQDLSGFSVHDNPLLAGILATHRLRSNDSVVTRPYVLLLVRPAGILDFYPAQRVLNDSRIHFGYELLSEDEQIAVAAPVEGETEAVRMAVLDTLSRRNQHLAGASDLRQRIAALQAKEAIRKRSQASADPRYDGPSDESHGEWADAPIVRPFPDSTSAYSGEEPDAVASNGRTEFNESWQDRASGGSPASEHLKERRSIQELLNPGLDIERSLAAAVEARRQSTVAGAEPFRFYEPEQPEQPDSEQRSGTTSSGDELVERSYDLNDWGTGSTSDQNVREEVRDVGNPHNLSPGAIADGRSTSSDRGSRPTPQNNLPPLEGHVYRSGDAAQQQNSYASVPSGGDHPGSVAGAQVSQPAELNLTYYEPVIVYLDPQCFTVAGDDPVPLHGAPIAAILDALLIDIEKATGKGPELAFVRRLPVVKFVVSPGAHTLYFQVAAGLHDRGIPASSVVSMESYAEEQSTDAGSALRSLDPAADRSLNARRASEYQELP